MHVTYMYTYMHMYMYIHILYHTKSFPPYKYVTREKFPTHPLLGIEMTQFLHQIFQYIPIFGRFLCEYPQKVVSLFAWFKGTWDDDIAAGVEVKALEDLSSVGERSRVTGAVVVVHVLLSHHSATVLWRLRVHDYAT